MSNLMVFDMQSYIKDLKLALHKAMQEAREHLIKEIKRNVSSIQFKTNKVRLVGGYETSDADRKQSVINSILCRELRWYSSYTLSMTITALSTNFKESHIGIYYEYGTGLKASSAGARFDEMGTWNKYRTGKAIVSRSKFINYSGIGLGKWVDMGGNVRITGSKRAGETNLKFRNYIGRDIQAYRWFSGTFKQRIKFVMSMFRKAVNKVKIGKYIKLNPHYVLGAM